MHEFLTATLNYSIDRTEKIILLKQEIERLNINFLKPDINNSNSLFSIEKNETSKSIRFGLAAARPNLIDFEVSFFSIENKEFELLISGFRKLMFSLSISCLSKIIFSVLSIE